MVNKRLELSNTEFIAECEKLKQEANTHKSLLSYYLKVCEFTRTQLGDNNAYYSFLQGLQSQFIEGEVKGNEIKTMCVRVLKAMILNYQD